MANKKRLDVLVYERGLAPSREMAQRYILAGEITVNGSLSTKSGMKVPIDSEITLKEQARFVSRGGLKLDGAFNHFSIAAEGKICADLGASTGGFTDCLLQRGASKVYAIDVGYGQLADKLRKDSRVINLERTNARYLEKLDEAVSLVVIDASFISLKLLLPVVLGWLTPAADVIPLIKPQFEAGKKDVGKGGIIKDTEVHRRVLHDVLSQIQQIGYTIRDLTLSDITGSKGNIEFLAWLTNTPTDSPTDLSTLINTVLLSDQNPDPNL